MIYPAVYNIVALQDSTWKASLRLTGTARDVSIDVSNNLFTSPCHGLSVNNPIIFTAKTIEGVTFVPPCGLETNKPYYVIAAGLTDDVFAVSETIGGSSIGLHGALSGALKFAAPIDITGAVIDADIKLPSGGSTIRSFTCTILAPLLGEFQMLLSSANTVALDPRSYAYDLSITTLAGEKYYWLTGRVEIKKTYSRA